MSNNSITKLSSFVDLFGTHGALFIIAKVFNVLQHDKKLSPLRYSFLPIWLNEIPTASLPRLNEEEAQDVDILSFEIVSYWLLLKLLCLTMDRKIVNLIYLSKVDLVNISSAYEPFMAGYCSRSHYTDHKISLKIKDYLLSVFSQHCKFLPYLQVWSDSWSLFPTNW